MPHPSKVKGNNYEREINRQAKAAGWEAERAYGSNGRALGESEQCDNVLISPNRRYTVQAKRRAAIADYVKPPQNVDLVIMRGDRDESLVVMRYKDFLKWG